MIKKLLRFTGIHPSILFVFLFAWILSAIFIIFQIFNNPDFERVFPLFILMITEFFVTFLFYSSYAVTKSPYLEKMLFKNKLTKFARDRLWWWAFPYMVIFTGFTGISRDFRLCFIAMGISLPFFFYMIIGSGVEQN